MNESLGHAVLGLLSAVQISDGASESPVLLTLGEGIVSRALNLSTASACLASAPLHSAHNMKVATSCVRGTEVASKGRQQ